ncbi:unnamed protein product [Closterium sp. Yama58-4]|nr:unnamed protein product [Closterium sp. Yama58-4]
MLGTRNQLPVKSLWWLRLVCATVASATSFRTINTHLGSSQNQSHPRIIAPRSLFSNPPVSARPRQLVTMARFSLLTALALLLAVTVTLSSFAPTAAYRVVRYLADGKTCIEVESLKNIDGYCSKQTQEPASLCQKKLNQWIADCNNPKDKGFGRTAGRYLIRRGI